MEFPTNINKYLKVNQDGFIICTRKTVDKQINPHFLNDGTKMMHQIINHLGENSAKSQGLKQIITTYIKFQNCDHRIYIKVEDNKAIGFLRTGQKKLFYHDNVGQIREITPTCVLDIYVHESYQRTGIGKQIFQKFLKYQNKNPQKLAYDRPSPKLIAFLKKHYGLSKFIAQNNNFVVFDQYFSSNSTLTKNSTAKLTNETLLNEGSTTNRFYKYENKKQFQIKPQIPVQNKNVNKTLPISSRLIKQQVKPPAKQILKGGKIQDSLSLLEKEMNRMHLTKPNLSISSKQIKKEHNVLNGSFHNAQMTKQNMSNFGCPWATEQNIQFRTTSGSYGSHYNRYK